MSDGTNFNHIIKNLVNDPIVPRSYPEEIRSHDFSAIGMKGVFPKRVQLAVDAKSHIFRQFFELPLSFLENFDLKFQESP